MSSPKRVAVIGGGFAGMLMGKALIEEDIDFVCFEKSSEVGGTWCYRKTVQYGLGSTTSTTTTINSKETSAISNELSTSDVPNFLRHFDVYKYGMEVFNKYGLVKRVLCNKEVVNVSKTPDYDETGRWIVTIQDTKTKNVTSEVFDAVMVCTGHFAHPFMPTYPGINTFEGRILHSHSLRTYESFAMKRVVVVGFGTSALDAAVEISRVATQVYLSSRSHSWVLPRTVFHGLPIDLCIYRRFFLHLLRIDRAKYASSLVESCICNGKFNHALFGIHPSSPILSKDPVINDDISSRISLGSVILKKNIKVMLPDKVLFYGEEEPTSVDDIVFATGYRHDYSFLEDGILLGDKQGKYHLYKCMYPPHLKHPTLAIIGFILPWGPGLPSAELQTRWATHLLQGYGSLPSPAMMMEEIDRRYANNCKRYLPSEIMSQRIDTMDYCDDLASEIGAKPNFLKMALSDPKLFFACIFGPFLTYQYRLEGPHKWDGARKTILTTGDRVKKSLCAKNEYKSGSLWEFFVTFAIMLILVFGFVLWLVFFLSATASIAVICILLINAPIRNCVLNFIRQPLLTISKLIIVILLICVSYINYPDSILVV